MNSAEERSFWKLVGICLKEFWQIESASSRTAKVLKFRKEMVANDFAEAVYHEEPYYVARLIAGVDANYDEDWPSYISYRQQVLESLAKSSVKLKTPNYPALTDFSGRFKVKESSRKTKPAAKGSTKKRTTK